MNILQQHIGNDCITRGLIWNEECDLVIATNRNSGLPFCSATSPWQFNVRIITSIGPKVSPRYSTRIKTISLVKTGTVVNETGYYLNVLLSWRRYTWGYVPEVICYKKQPRRTTKAALEIIRGSGGLFVNRHPTLQLFNCANVKLCWNISVINCIVLFVVRKVKCWTEKSLYTHNISITLTRFKNITEGQHDFKAISLGTIYRHYSCIMNVLRPVF